MSKKTKVALMISCFLIGSGLIVGGIYITPLLAPAGAFLTASIGFGGRLAFERYKEKKKEQNHKPEIVCVSNPHLNDYTVNIGPNLIFMGPQPSPPLVIANEVANELTHTRSRDIVYLHP